MNFVVMCLLATSSFFLMSCSKTTKITLSKEQVLTICLDEKKKAISPEAEVNLSKSQKGNSVGFSISFGSNFLKGIDPNTVYADCIKRLSEQKKIRHCKSQVKPKGTGVSLFTLDGTFHNILEFYSQTLGYTGIIYTEGHDVLFGVGSGDRRKLACSLI